MNVSLTPQLEAMVREKVESGLYNNASEVVREALRRMVEQDQAQLDRLRAALAIGLEQIERGETIRYTPEVHAEILANARRKAAEGATPDPNVVP